MSLHQGIWTTLPPKLQASGRRAWVLESIAERKSYDRQTITNSAISFLILLAAFSSLTVAYV